MVEADAFEGWWFGGWGRDGLVKGRGEVVGGCGRGEGCGEGLRGWREVEGVCGA